MMLGTLATGGSTLRQSRTKACPWFLPTRPTASITRAIVASTVAKPANATIANDTDGPAELQAALTAMLPKLKSTRRSLLCHWSNEAETRAAIEAAGYKVRNSLVWVKNNTGMGDPKTTFAPKHERIIYAVKGSPTLFEREADVLLADRVDSGRHPTEKPVGLLRRLIEVTTVTGEIVADPFGGVASTLVAAKESGRAYWGCELSEEYHKAGGDRLGSTESAAPFPMMEESHAVSPLLFGQAV